MAVRKPLMEVPGTVTINRWRALSLPSPWGNSKIELVKSVTIHGGKCLAVPANANEAHVRSKTEQGWAGRNGAQFKNDTVWQTHSSRGQRVFYGPRTHRHKWAQSKVASDIQVTIVSVSFEIHPLPTCSIKSLDKTCHYRQTLDFIRWQDGDRVKYIALLLSDMNLNKHGCTYWTQTIIQLDWTWKTKCHPSKMALKGLFVFKYTKHIQISHCFTCPHWVNYKKFSVLSYFFKVSDQWEVLQG